MNSRLTCNFIVRERGLEPLRPKTPGPKPDAAASYATPALARRRGQCMSGSADAELAARLVRRVGQGMPSSRRSSETWPVALTLYMAFSSLPSGPTTKVDRMTPITVLP